jgi:hypothetical protein
MEWVRNLGLPKDLAEILGSRLCEKVCLAQGQTSRRGIHSLFSQEGLLVCCKNIAKLVHRPGLSEYDLSEWRLFVDACKRSLKGVLHKGNVYGSVSVTHSVLRKQPYENLETLLWIKYQEHNWPICGHFKILYMLLGQQSGYTKHPCFMCEWDSRAQTRHRIQKDWLPGEKLVVGSKIIAHPSLVAPSKVILPPLRIKLGVMKQFVKALNKEGDCFKYICQKFTALTEAKLKDGIFTGPDIRKICLMLYLEVQ